VRRHVCTYLVSADEIQFPVALFEHVGAGQAARRDTQRLLHRRRREALPRHAAGQQRYGPGHYR
jgi:hypothetical protein